MSATFAWRTGEIWHTSALGRKQIMLHHKVIQLKLIIEDYQTKLMRRVTMHHKQFLGIFLASASQPYIKGGVDRMF